MKGCPKDFKPVYYKRYVDDICGHLWTIFCGKHAGGYTNFCLSVTKLTDLKDLIKESILVSRNKRILSEQVKSASLGLFQLFSSLIIPLMLVFIFIIPWMILILPWCFYVSIEICKYY